jgi:serine/threonine protein kinase
MAVRIENLAEPLPGYRLIERLGGGGFGEVWKAEAPGGLFKAIKFVFGDLRGAGDVGQRAEQELKALSRVKTVRHPYILSLERYDIIEGQLMIVMELADRNLWDRFKECRSQGLPGIPREEMLGYMEETAEALDLMNQEYQLQHLDIKPQNLFLVHNHVKVADFGLVKDMEGREASVTGGVTPVYAAPETFDGWVSRYSDQYSLAIVFQELLTGQRPFAGGNVRQLIMQHLQAPPNVSPLPIADQPFIARALAKNPDDRFAQCRDLVRQLRQNPAGPTARTSTAPIVSAPTKPLHTPPPADRTCNEAGEVPSDDGPPSSSLRATPDSNQGITHCIRAIEVAAAGIDRQTAPPEQHGDGVLFPALIIGVGQMGLTVLQRLRRELTERFGPLENVPCLKLLLLDTDPEIVRMATRGPQHATGGGPALSASEVLLAPLQRPSHYLRPREGRPALETWLNPRMLYRIPRSQVTTGVRALGRLAFCDNYRAIVRRLRTDLEAILDPKALETAQRHTHLGLRSNRPRVYILAGLGGGTGSGVFLDLAYTVRALLRQAGYDKPDLAGLLMLPPADRQRTRTLQLGNTCAALTELLHFADPEMLFSAQYHEREPTVRDVAPPFERTVLLPLPEETDEVATREVVDQAGEYLYRDLCTPLGRAADLARAGLPAPPWPARGQFYQTFGLFQVAWPRRTLLRTTARQMCQRLVTRWLSKDSKPIREAVREWVKEQWSGLGLGRDAFIGRLRDSVQKDLKRSAEAVLYGVTEPLAERLAALPPPRKGSPPPPGAEVTPEEIANALVEYDRLLGRPQEDGTAEQPGDLACTLRRCAGALGAEWGQRLAELPVALIEEPGFRLAGAEEAVRDMIAEIERVLQHHEPLARDLTGRAGEAYGRLQVLAGLVRGARRQTLPGPEVLELLRNYPKWRYQSLMLQQTAGVFVGLRGHLSDTLREINFCRVRLTELLRRLEIDPDRTSPEGTASAPETGKRLYPGGSRTLKEAVERLLAAVTPELLLELDGRQEAMLKQRFQALVHVCMTTSNVVKEVEKAMLGTAEEFAAELLGQHDVAAMFQEQHANEEQARGEIEGYHREAEPEMAADRRARIGEQCVLAVPPGPAGDAFRHLVAETTGEVELTVVPGAEEIVFYRERSNLKLADLELLGPLGQEAYRQMSAGENYTPHTRLDVPFARVVEARPV